MSETGRHAEPDLDELLEQICNDVIAELLNDLDSKGGSEDQVKVSQADLVLALSELRDRVAALEIRMNKAERWQR